MSASLKLKHQNDILADLNYAEQKARALLFQSREQNAELSQRMSRLCQKSDRLQFLLTLSVVANLFALAVLLGELFL